MENQSNTNSQTTQQINPAPVEQNTYLKHKTSLLFSVIVTLLISVIFGIGGYYLGTQQNKTDSNSHFDRIATTSSPIVEIQPSVAHQQSDEPKLVAFMRNGEIWIKDYQADTENKVSSSVKVGTPKFSPDAKYLTYFEIIHAPGGFPRYSLYVSDKNGEYEKSFDMGANHIASKLKWSQDGKLLGLVLFANELPGSENYKEEAYIYDPVTRKEVLIGRLADRQTGNDSYSVDSSCEELEASYVSFCNDYVSYISKDAGSEYAGNYKQDEFLQSKYTKQYYKLTRSEKLDNGLVVLEYYTGEAQNPEASWEVGGGSFKPGYDEGVTETYTVLLDESAGKVVDEIDNAIDCDFYLGR